ncbi:ribosome-associated translation inhibitor RaiA [Candidatus Babeliales bacterium]|nr:ribosome-associated translation inhibitor RaiA [Candidatus Babeliales bacterium]
MKRLITFHNMPSSEPMTKHTNEKLNKIEEFLKEPGSKFSTPMQAEIWLKANPQHPHHEGELKLKTPQFLLSAHDKGTDMYFAIDNTIDKMVKLLLKEKKKLLDKRKKVDTEKAEFLDDKYNL